MSIIASKIQTDPDVKEYTQKAALSIKYFYTCWLRVIFSLLGENLGNARIKKSTSDNLRISKGSSDNP